MPKTSTLAQNGAVATDTNGFTRLVIVRNPVSTNADRAEAYVWQLHAFFNSVETVELATVAGGLLANQALLQRHEAAFGPGTLLVVIAGDGTINMIVGILLSLSERARQTVVLPLWGGNANDLAHMLNGRAPKSLEPLLKGMRPIAVRPLECRLEFSNGDAQTRLAVCYASFGASAAAARRLGQRVRGEHPAHKIPGVRFAREVGSVWRALKRAPAFDVIADGKSQTMYECVVVNGSRLAKIGGLPLKLSDEHFHVGIVARKNALIFGLRYLQMRSRRQTSRFQRHQLAFETQDPLWAQFDGETVEIVAGTTVALDLHAHAVRLLATRL